MKKDGKEIKHTIKVTNQSKNYRKPMDSNTAVWVEEYLNFFTGKMQPVPEAFLDKLAEELINYAETIVARTNRKSPYNLKNLKNKQLKKKLFLRESFLSCFSSEASRLSLRE